MTSTGGLVKRLTKNINKLLQNSDGQVDSILSIKNDYYTKHSNVLKNVLFRDTFFVSRFANIHFDLIVSKNTSIHYLMKHQFENGNLIYDLIFGFDFSKIDNNNNNNNIHDTLIDNIGSIDSKILNCYYNEVQKQVILPLLSKHDIYSDNLFNIIFYKLVLHMGYMYSHCNEFKKSIHELLHFKTNDMKYTIKLPIVFENKMLTEERTVWQKMIK